MIFYEFIPIKKKTIKSQKSSCQRHVSDMLPGNPRSSDRLTFVKTQDLIEDERVSRVSYILEILETWKPDSKRHHPIHPMFFGNLIFSARNWSDHFETNPEIRRVRGREANWKLWSNPFPDHRKYWRVPTWSHKMNKSNASTRVPGDWLKPWWKTATFFLSLQSVVSVYWRLWYRNYVQRSDGEVSKRMKITEKSIGINLINLIPSTFSGYPMILLFVKFQFLSVKSGWSWLKTRCWVAISLMAHVQHCDLTMGQTFITLSQLFVGLCQAILRWGPRGKETNLFTFLILSLCWFGNSQFLILGTHMLFV